MPLLGTGEYREVNIHHDHPFGSQPSTTPVPVPSRPIRKQSQHSMIAKSAIMTQATTPSTDGARTPEDFEASKEKYVQALGAPTSAGSLAAPANGTRQGLSNGAALTDTPLTTAPSSPNMQDSGNSTRSRPTTLDIPGLTKSRVSPDGKISQRDIGSKLVIVMVGLPARGKSYITKKIARYLNWLQHDTRIFNVGERRRVAAAAPVPTPSPRSTNRSISSTTASLNGILKAPATPSAKIQINGKTPPETPHAALPMPALNLDEEVQPLQSLSSEENGTANSHPVPHHSAEPMDPQTAEFFDPNNEKAAHIRDDIAMATLDELLDYILDRGGSVGIFDATNSTLERRKMVMQRIKDRAGPELGVLFLESLCIDETILESNMRLKLSGPDYKDQDPVTALEDFKKRVALYEQKYVPLGLYEEKNNMPYVSMIDVGRKVVAHQVGGFLSAQLVSYLLNFNLAARQIWITRHGESVDNVNGKIGGDSDLSGYGHAYARALTAFTKHERQVWDIHQRDKALSTHFPPQEGDTTPPNPDYNHGEEDGVNASKSFCVWTSMLKRSIQTAQYFDEDDFDIKQMRMLDELNAGNMEGLTYEEIMTKHAYEYQLRKGDKLNYRYPGAGGEGYLDIINRLRPVIVEVERMTDHVLLVGHRSVARVLLAYFMGLKREDVADLDVPLGMLYMLEPKPYGVDFKAYKYNHDTQWFDHVPDWQMQRATTHTAA
ncbi:hypothetical protein P7C71_g144, partial [Lecanoromycetidae sp. Uapishka_2]